MDDEQTAAMDDDLVSRHLWRTFEDLEACCSEQARALLRRDAERMVRLAELQRAPARVEGGEQPRWLVK